MKNLFLNCRLKSEFRMNLKLKNKPLTRSILVFALIVVIVRLIGITSFPDKVFPGIQLFFSKILYSISSRFSFSIGDLFYTLLILLAVFFVFVMIFRLIKKDYLKFRKTLATVFYILSGFYLTLYLFWGFNYYRTPIKDSYNVELDTVDELKRLAEFYYSKAMIYRTLVNENERGVFEAKITASELEAEILKSKEKLAAYPEMRFSGYSKPNLKKSTYSKMSSYLGISGYYNPFTNESQYNSISPDSRRLFAKLHETGHQFGFATESEANFAGFLFGAKSENIDLLYAVNFRAMRSLLNRILWYDPEYVKDFIENRYSPGMKRDREFEIEIDAEYNNGSDDAFALMNEAFLRLNNQEGLESYGRFVELLVGFHRKYGVSE